MLWWRKKTQPTEAPEAIQDRIRRRFASFRELLFLNNESLELLAGIQEDLQFTPPSRAVFEGRIASVFEKAMGVVASLEKLTGYGYSDLSNAVEAQRSQVEQYMAGREDLRAPKLSASLAELDMGAVAEAGSKAAALGEIKNKLGLPVPDGYVLTADAYRQFCGIPCWEQIRSLTHNLDLNNPSSLQEASAKLISMVMACPVPRAMEVALVERARRLEQSGAAIAVRSSAVGEGGERSFAGQFVSLLNVPVDQVVEGYKKVIAGRFSERALFYRLSAGISEIDSPMAVLCLAVVPARASGILYTREPQNAKSDTLWVTATHGLGLDIAGGRAQADLFVLSRARRHKVVDQTIVTKKEAVRLASSGGVERRQVDSTEAAAPSLREAELSTLAEWALRIEEHFGTAQDIEWAIDYSGQIWIVQARPLVLAESPVLAKGRPKGEPLLAGGRTVFPGRVSGPAYLAADLNQLSKAPQGAILFLRKASPNIVTVFPKLAGVVTEWGNVAGHVAALLREAKIPSLFGMSGAFERLQTGDAVSLDAVQPSIYAGSFWPTAVRESTIWERYRERPKHADPINRRLLVLHLLDPSASDFCPRGCQSAHDVLRFCHEKAVEAMFAVNDAELERNEQCSKRLLAEVPINLHVLDLGGGLALDDPSSPDVEPRQIVSRPFQALWRGLTHPEVTWRRGLPVSISDVASVVGTSMMSNSGAMRALGDRSYLLVTDEYLNLNSRLAYHFTLLDTCLSDTAGHNYISFRFAGGGSSEERRSLRACFIEACLAHYGFLTDRRGDLVNAWFKNAPPEAIENGLEMLGRLMACASQLDMYMSSQTVMRTYVQRFLEGNYASFLPEAEARSAV